MARTQWAIVVLLLALAALVAACASGQRSYQGLPDYAFRSEAALQGYKTALEHRALLNRLPCYCGCGQDPQYTSLADCFFSSQEGYNPHAANCAICLEEAEDAARMHKQDLGLAQVRQAIEDAYRERGPGTKTPPIELGEEVER